MLFFVFTLTLNLTILLYLYFRWIFWYHLHFFKKYYKWYSLSLSSFLLVNYNSRIWSGASLKKCLSNNLFDIVFLGDGERNKKILPTVHCLTSWELKKILKQSFGCFFLDFSKKVTNRDLLCTVQCTAYKMSVFGVILVLMRENTDQNNCEYRHFSRSDEYNACKSVFKKAKNRFIADISW